MIAEIYPLKRLPRSMNFFDYRIPDDMDLKRGEYVKVSLRGKEVWGVVRRVKMIPERGVRLKTILEKYTGLELREAELSFFESLAHDLIQSVSSVLFASLPVPPKRASQTKPETPPLDMNSVTIPKREVATVSRLTNDLRTRRECTVQVPDLRRMAVLLAAYRTAEPDEKIIVLTPTIREAEWISRYLHHLNPHLLTGEEGPNSRFRIYEQLKKSSSFLLIGTNVAGLLLDSSVHTYIFINASSPNHKQADRNPRVDYREALWKFHEQIQANIFFFDPLPRSIDIHRVADTNRLVWDMVIKTHILDMNTERQGAPHFSLSAQAEQAIHDCLSRKQHVLCVLNRKGTSAGLSCLDCGRLFKCQACQTTLRVRNQTLVCLVCAQPFPLPCRCPFCQGVNLRQLAVGVDGFVQILKLLFPQENILVHEKGSPCSGFENGSQVLVTTDYFFETLYDPLDRDIFGLVLLIDADMSLYSSRLSAREQAVHDVLVWRGVAQAFEADFFLQTSYPEFFSENVADPNRLYKHELDVRSRYQAPPFARYIQIVYRDDEKRKSELAIDTLIRSINRIPSVDVGIKKQTTNGTSVRLGIHKDHFPELLSFFTDLSDQYIIDTNVIF